MHGGSSCTSALLRATGSKAEGCVPFDSAAGLSGRRQVTGLSCDLLAMPVGAEGEGSGTGGPRAAAGPVSRGKQWTPET